MQTYQGVLHRYGGLLDLPKHTRPVALSGAGPSLIAFSGQPANAAIGIAMKQSFEAAGLQARIFPLNISHSGASVIHDKAL